MNTAVSSIARSTLIIAPCGADAHGEDSRDRRNVHGPGRTGRATSDIPSVSAFAASPLCHARSHAGAIEARLHRPPWLLGSPARRRQFEMGDRNGAVPQPADG